MDNSTKELLKKIQQIFKEKNYESVIKEINSFFQENDLQPDIINFKATALREIGNYEEAKRAYLEGLRLDPKNTHLLNNLAKLLIHQKQCDSARQILQNLIKRNPNDPIANANLDEIKRQEKISDDIKKELSLKNQRQKPLQPLQSAFDSFEVSDNRKNQLERQKLKREKELRQPPTLPDLDQEVLIEELCSAGREALRSGNPKVALQFSQRAINIGSQKSAAYLLASDIYIELKQYNHAHLCLLIAAQFEELEASYQLNLMSLASTLGDHQLLSLHQKRLEELVKDGSELYEKSQKVVNQLDGNASVELHPINGPCKANTKK